MRFFFGFALPGLLNALDRSGTSDFISQQIRIMTKMQQEQEKRAKELEQRKLKRASAAPPLPA